MQFPYSFDEEEEHQHAGLANIPQQHAGGNNMQISGPFEAGEERQHADVRQASTLDNATLEVFRQLESWSLAESPAVPACLSEARQRETVELLQDVVTKGNGPERIQAQACLKKTLDLVVTRRSRPLNCHPLENDIRRLLGIPLLANETPTFGDGDCLYAAWFGQETEDGYRCPEANVDTWRQKLKAELEKLNPLELPGEVKTAIDVFLHNPSGERGEQVARFFPEDRRPGEAYDSLDNDPKKAVLNLFANECGEAKQYLFPPLVPFIAAVEGRPVSLYQDHEAVSGDGWLHYDAHGKRCEGPVEGAVAIRYDLCRQHFERVEPPARRAAPGDGVHADHRPRHPIARSASPQARQKETSPSEPKGIKKAQIRRGPIQECVATILLHSGLSSAKEQDLLVGQRIPPHMYYAGFGVASAAAGGGAAVKGNSADPLKNLPLGLEPAPLLKSFTYIVPFVIGQARVIDSLLTADGLSAARNTRLRELTECGNHLKALMGLEALDLLEKTRQHILTAEDKAHIKWARAQLILARDKSRKSFYSIIPAVHDVIRTQVAAVRDVGGNTVNSVLAVLNFADKINADIAAKDGFKLIGAAEGLSKVLPYLNVALGITSGSLSLTHGAMEIDDAGRSEEALAAADIADKEVVAQYGEKFPELKALLKWRELARELERTFARWLKAHGGVRVAYGAAALTQAALGIAIGVAAGAVGGATLGASLILGLLAGAFYMLWINVRAVRLQKAQREYDKVLQAINTLAGLAQADLPGLNVGMLALNDIATAIEKSLKNPKTVADMTQALLGMGVSQSAITEAITQEQPTLKDSLLPPRGIPVHKEQALRNMYARRKATAADQLRVTERWQADPELASKNLAAGKAAANTEGWGKYLASGEHVGDLRKSSLTRALVVKFWKHEKFRALMDTFREPSEIALTAEVAWQRLDKQRKEQAIEEKAAATVLGWIEGRKLRTITNCLKAGEKNAEIPEFVALKKLGIKTKDGPDNKEIVDVGSLRKNYINADLHINNIAQIRAACKASGNSEKSEFFECIDQFVIATEKSLGPAEKGAFIKALGGPGKQRPLPLEKGSETHYSFSTRDPDAVLKRIQQFLLVSEKLQRQPVKKVIAALHAYPTDEDIPRDLLHIAAVRSLRLAYRDRDPNDVDDAISLAKQLARKPLHRRTLGAGEGGGVMGFGGYELNKKGLAVLDLLKGCRTLPPPPHVNSDLTSLSERYSYNPRDSSSKEASISQAGLNQDLNEIRLLDTPEMRRRYPVANAVAQEGSSKPQFDAPLNANLGGQPVSQADPTQNKTLEGSALSRSCDRLLFKNVNHPDEIVNNRDEIVRSLDDLVDELAVLRDPSALKDALEFGGKREYAMAKRSLSKHLETAVKAIETAAESYDGVGFVENALKVIELEKLSRTYRLNLKARDADLPPKVLARWRFYQDALRWPNTTARNKNAAAIAAEIPLLPVSGAAGPERSHLWSAQFLKAQPAKETKKVMEDLERRYPWTEGMSYKEAAQAINDLDRMSSKDVFKAVKAFDSRHDDIKKNRGYRWVAKQFMVRGLEMPQESEKEGEKEDKKDKDKDVELMQDLARATDKHEFLRMMEKCLHPDLVSAENPASVNNAGLRQQDPEQQQQQREGMVISPVDQ